MNNDNFMEFQNKFKSIQYFFSYTLNPILKNPKFNFLFMISKNWENIIDKKYKNYCYIEKVFLNKENNQGTIYIISNNSAISFYLNNNKQYIIEKINIIFGYKAVTNIYIKEIPMEIIRKENYQNESFEITNDDIDKIKETINIKNEELRKSLIELKISINKNQK